MGLATYSMPETLEMRFPNLRCRPADATEMDSIYLMGYDAWSNGSSEVQYLQSCRDSPKYKSGSWYVLSSDGVPVASLLLHEFAPWDDWAVRGIGSVATAPRHRKQGCASRLVNNVITDLAGMFPKVVVLLYSDIDPAFYERLGFTDLPEGFQRLHSARLMARMVPGWDEAVLHRSKSRVPGYF